MREKSHCTHLVKDLLFKIDDKMLRKKGEKKSLSEIAYFRT